MLVATTHRLTRVGRLCLWLAAAASALALLLLPTAAYAADAIHVIQPGDSLGKVARQYNVDPATLAAYNQIGDPNRILIGQSIRIPGAGATGDAAAVTLPAAVMAAPPAEHVVARGESLTAISRRYGLDVQELMRINGVTNPNHIEIGQTLRLSAVAVAAPAARAETPAPPRQAPAMPSQAATAAATVEAGGTYVVQAGDSLSRIAQAHGLTMQQLMRANAIINPEVVYVGQTLRIPGADAAAAPVSIATAPAVGERWILVNLTQQTLTAYQGDTAVMYTHVSTGKPSTPTVPGEFRIYAKIEMQDMSGPGYHIEDVPWVMFYDGDFAIHGAYWHAAFGTPTSRGCVNMRQEEARSLFDWASVGTRVVIQY